MAKNPASFLQYWGFRELMEEPKHRSIFQIWNLAYRKTLGRAEPAERSSERAFIAWNVIKAPAWQIPREVQIEEWRLLHLVKVFFFFVPASKGAIVNIPI